MIRWGNIIGFAMLLLGIFAMINLVEVCSIHGPNLVVLYERIFRPELRPVFWLELLVFAIVVLRGIRGSMNRRNDGDDR